MSANVSQFLESLEDSRRNKAAAFKMTADADIHCLINSKDLCGLFLKNVCHKRQKMIRYFRHRLDSVECRTHELLGTPLPPELLSPREICKTGLSKMQFPTFPGPESGNRKGL